MRLALAPGLAALLLALPVSVFAHAIVVAAEPAVGTVVHGPKTQVVLRFNSRIDAQRSRLTLIYPNGVARPLTLAPNDAPDTLAAAVDGLSSGGYRLRWQVLAVDGHITRGDIPFTIAP